MDGTDFRFRDLNRGHNETRRAGHSPGDLFFEVAPLVIAAPEPGFGIDLGLGARVYP